MRLCKNCGGPLAVDMGGTGLVHALTGRVTCVAGTLRNVAEIDDFLALRVEDERRHVPEEAREFKRRMKTDCPDRFTCWLLGAGAKVENCRPVCGMYRPPGALRVTSERGGLR